MRKSAEHPVQSAGQWDVKYPVFMGRLSSVVSSADCRSAEQSESITNEVHEQNQRRVDGAAGIAPHQSAGHSITGEIQNQWLNPCRRTRTRSTGTTRTEAITSDGHRRAGR